MQHRDLQRFWKLGAFRLEGDDTHFVMVGIDTVNYTVDVIPKDKAKAREPEFDEDMVFQPKAKFKSHVITVDLDDLRPLKARAGYSDTGVWVGRHDIKEWNYFLHTHNSSNSDLAVTDTCPIHLSEDNSIAYIQGWVFA